MFPSRSSSNAHSFLLSTLSAASTPGHVSNADTSKIMRAQPFIQKSQRIFTCSEKLEAGDRSGFQDVNNSNGGNTFPVVALGDITVSGVAAFSAHGNVVGLDQGDLVLRKRFVCA